jgi:hypothetical protein
MNKKVKFEIVKEEEEEEEEKKRRKMQTNLEAIISIVFKIKIGIVVKHLQFSSHHFFVL